MAKEEKVKLLGFWPSPFSFRVEWALKLKGVEYEYVEEDVFNRSPLLLELNPVHKKVPVLVDGAKVIVESFIILEYIDETWEQTPLLPRDPYGRAMARFWANFSEEKIFKPACIAFWAEGGEQEGAVKSSIEALEKIEAELKLKGNKLFGGENIGYVDLAIGWVAYWLPVWEEVAGVKINPRDSGEIQFSATEEWMNNFLDHPVIKANLPPRDKMKVYFQKRRKEIAAEMAAARGY